MSTDRRKPENDLNTATNEEKAYTVLKFITKTTTGVLAPIGASGILNEAFDMWVTDPAVRRRNDYIMGLDQRLTDLEARGHITLDDVANNEDISALLLQSIQSATRSSGTRKLEALREVTVKGVSAKSHGSVSRAQVMLALVDRMTEHHIIALRWMATPKQAYSRGQLRTNTPPCARKSLHYGQPVDESPADLINPLRIYYEGADFALYVEHDERLAFKIAEADLRALGLSEPIFRNNVQKVGRTLTVNKSDEVAEMKVSNLGMHLLSFIERD